MSSDLWAQPCGATIQGGSNQTLDCGSTLNGSGSGGGPYTYSWTPASGLSNPNIANPVVTTSGTYTLSVTGPNCSGTGTATVNVTVTPTPSMSSSAPAQTSTYNGVQAFVLCAAGVLSHTFDFTNTTTAPTGSEYTVVWGNGNTTTHSSNNWTSSQTYNLGLSQGAITVTLPNGCISSVPFYVFVGDVPLGGLAVITPSICTGGSIEFAWSGYANNPPGTLYIVDYGDGTIETLTHPPAATLQHTYNVSSCTQPNGEFTVNWEISNPCDIRTGTINQIRVSEHPVAAFVLSPSDTVCVTTPVTFTDQSTGQQAPQCLDPRHVWTVAPGTYTITGGSLGSTNGFPNNPGQWTSGSDELTVLFNAPGTYTITDVVGNACGTDTLVRVVCVEAPPVPNFTLAPTSGCSPLVANTTNNSVSNSCHLVRTWSAEQLTAGCPPQPGSISFDALSDMPQFTFTGQGTYSVTLTMENTCGVFEQTVQPILVNGPPTISLAPIGPICQDDCIDLGPATVDDCDAPITTYGWTFANGTPNASAVQDPPQVCYPVAGTFNVTASVTNACGTASATQPLTVVPPPPVPTINGDLVLCAGESLVLTAPTGLSIYSWTGPAGASSNTNTLTIANVGPANAGTYTLTVGANNCTNTASVDVVVNPLPTPAISGPAAACSGDSVTLTLMNAAGYASFSWSAGGATTPSITVPPGSYTVTVTDANGCSNTATHAVIENPLPTVDAGDPLNPCIDSAPIPLTGGTPAGGTWSGTGVSAGSPQTFSPGLAGEGPHTLTYTYTDGNGCTNNDDVLATVRPLPTADAGPDAAVCAGTSLQLNGAASNGTPPYTYSWIPATNLNNPNIANPTFTYPPPLASPIQVVLTLTVTDNFGCSAADAVTVTVNPAPVIDAGADQEVCVGSTPIPLGGTPVDGTWTGPHVSGPPYVFTPNVTGSFDLIYDYDDINGCVNNDGITIVVHGLPAATVSGGGFVCSTSPLPDVTFTFTGTAPWTFSYTDGGAPVTITNHAATSYTIPNATAGTYSITALADAHCTGADLGSSVTVGVSPAATADAGGPYLTCGTSEVPVNATANGPGAWSAPTGTFADATATQTTYTYPNSVTVPTDVVLTWTTDDPDGNGPCPGVSATAVVTVNPPATATLPATASMCGNESITLDATTNNPGSWSGGAGTYSDPASPNTSYTPTTGEAGSTITLTWTTVDPDGNGPCEAAAASTDITVHPMPVADAGPDTTLCLNSGSVTLNGMPTGGAWSGPGVTPGGVFTPNVSGTFTLAYNYTDANNCVDSDTLSITVNEAAVAMANGPYAVCGVEPIALNATTNGTGAWSGGAGTFADSSDPATTYIPAAGEVGANIVLTWETFDPDGPGPCEGASDTAQLTISTPATAVPGGPYDVCSNSAVDISVTTTPGGGSWSGGSGTIADPSNPATTYTPAPFEAGTAVALTWTTVDPDGNGPCPPVSATVTVNVLEAAIAVANGPYAACGADPIALNATTNGSGTWSGGVGTFADSSDPATTYTPAAGEVGTNIVLTWETFDPDGPGPCEGASDTAELTISTPATAVPGGPYDVCSNSAVDISVTTTPGGGSWSGGIGTIADPSNPATTYAPDSTEAGTAVELTWTTVDPDGSGPCPQVSATVTVNVLEAAIAVANGPYEVCGSAPVPITAETNGTGFWTGGAGVFADPLEPSTTYAATPAEHGSTVVLTWTTNDPDGDGPCTEAVDTAELLVHTLPVADAGADVTLACGDEITGTASGGGGPGYSFAWSPTTGLVAPNSATTPVTLTGTYVLLVTDVNGCTDTDSIDVTVTGLEDMAQADDVEVCLFDAVDLEGSAVDGLAPHTFLWTPPLYLNPPTGIGATIEFTYSQPLSGDTVFTYILTVTDAYGCADTTLVHVTVHPLPVVLVGPDTSLCAYDPPFGLTGGPLGGTWAPSATVDPSALPFGPNTFEYTFTDANGCTNTDDLVVNVNEVPVAGISAPDTACVNASVSFINQTSCPTCANIGHLWDFGDNSPPSTLVSPQHTYADTGLYVVTLIAGSGFGCSDTATHTIRIIKVPEVGFTFTPGSGCGPLEVELANTSQGLPIAYLWNIESFGTSSLENPGPITFPSAPCDSTYYTIALIASNQCGAVSAVDSVKVYSPPQPLLAVSADTVCSPFTIEAYNETVCAWATTYGWDFGDGTVSSSQTLLVSNVYTADSLPETYPLTLSASNVCGTVSVTHNIVVYPNTVTAFFNTAPLVGCEPLPVQFDQSLLGVTFWSWDFGDGNTSVEEDPLHVYENAGTYIVTLVVSNGCALDTMTQTVTVNPAPIFDFVADPDTLCVLQPTSFTPLGDNITGFQWSFGDGATSTMTNPTHAYAQEGTYQVSLTAFSTLNGCPATVIHPVVVLTTPEASVTAVPSEGCAPLTVNFDGFTTIGDLFVWDFGDGNTAQGTSPTHTYLGEGVYTAQVIASNLNGCSDTANAVITVFPLPIADFSYEMEVSPEAILPVVFENLSIGAYGYQWHFGDGHSSTFKDPAHVYNLGSSCQYEPMLIATNEYGCKDTAVKILAVPRDLRVWVPNAFSPDGNGLNEEFVIQGADWELSTVHLMIFDRWGELIHETKGVTPAWDGRMNGKMVKNDVYVWKIKARLKCGYDEVEHIGHVTVVR